MIQRRSTRRTRKSVTWTCRAASILLLLFSTLQFLENLESVVNGELKGTMFADPCYLIWFIFGLFLPFSAYVTYFLLWGKRARQTVTALCCCGILTVPMFAYCLHAGVKRFPSGHPSAELIVNSLFMLVLITLIWIGCLSKRRDLRPWVAEDYHFLCAECGYDLTGNTSGVCPECGKALEGGTERNRENATL